METAVSLPSTGVDLSFLGLDMKLSFFLSLVSDMTNSTEQKHDLIESEWRGEYQQQHHRNF